MQRGSESGDGIGRTENDNESPLTHESLEVGNLSIDLIGVQHTYEDFLRMEAELERYIAQANFVVCESHLSVGAEQPIAADSETFFGGIERIAKKYGKTIVSIDPLLGAKVSERPDERIEEQLRAAGEEKRIAHGVAGGARRRAFGERTCLSEGVPRARRCRARRSLWARRCSAQYEQCRMACGCSQDADR